MSETFRKNAYGTPVGRETVRADFPGFTFGVFVDPPGQVWANFVHDTDEFVVVAEGAIDIAVGSEEMRCGPGDLVLIPTGADHSLRTTRDAGSRWYYSYGHFGDDHG